MVPVVLGWGMNNRYLVSRERFIAAPPEVIFDVLATPALHSAIDGSGTLRAPSRAARNG